MTHTTAQLLDQSSFCMTYADSLADILLLLPVKELLPKNVTPKTLQNLLNYDLSHETELAKTLETYLYQRNDINKTAKALHIHRNTLIYRLNKIRDLTEADIDDPSTAWRLQQVFQARRLLE